MEQRENWFSRVRRVASNGIYVNGTLRHSHPVRECPICGELFTDGFCKCGGKAGWRQTNCKKCDDNSNALVFRSDEDQYEFFIFCQKCGKWEIVQGLPNKPVRNTGRSIIPPEVGMDDNCPPPLGSPVKPKLELVKG